MKNPKSRIIIVVVVLVVIGAAAWYFVSPLFINRAVNEEFPIEVPSPEELAQMPVEQLTEIQDDVMESAAAMPDKVMEEPMPSDSEAVAQSLAQGQFVDADNFHRGSGIATIYVLPDDSHVLRLENFMVTNGPDLHVLLSSAATPTSQADLGSDYVDLGSLKGNVGDQNYIISNDVVLDRYKSVVIYCLPFHVVFSTATLSLP